MPRTVEFNGESHEFPDGATDDQIREALAGHHNDQASSDFQSTIKDFRAKYPFWSQVALAVPDALGGIGSGAVGTGVGAYNLARKIPGMDSVLPPVSKNIQAATVPPPSVMGTVGNFAEHAAEFLAPGAIEGEALAKLPTAARIAGQVANDVGVTALQSGGDPTAMATAGATSGAMGAAGAAVGPLIRGTIGKVLKAAPSPLSQDAVDLAAREGIPVNQGAAGGSKTVQRAEQILGTTVAADKYENLIKGQQEGMNATADKLANGMTVTPFQAGQGTLGKLIDFSKDRAMQSSNAYDALAAIEADPKNIKSIPVGQKPMMGQNGQPMLDASGNPLSTAITKNIALPVDISAAKAKLQPIRDLIMQELPVGQQQYSKGLHAIQQILDGPDVQPASIVDRNLSAIKQIEREAVTPKTKFLANRALDALSPQVDKAVAAGGPDATKALQAGRSLWKDQAQTLDLIDSIGGNAKGTDGQVAVSDHLLTPRDANYPDLQRVLKVAPGARRDLADAAMGKVFGKSLENEGAYTSPARAADTWNRIGDQTKAALFEPQHVKDVDAFMSLSKRLSANPNPSGSGAVVAMVQAGLASIAHPAAGVSAVAFGRPLAKVLFDPEGASALNALIKAKPGSQDQYIATSILKAMTQTSAEKISASDQQPIQASITKASSDQ